MKGHCFLGRLSLCGRQLKLAIQSNFKEMKQLDYSTLKSIIDLHKQPIAPLPEMPSSQLLRDVKVRVFGAMVKHD